MALIHSIEGELVSEVTLREHALTPQTGGRAALRTPRSIQTEEKQNKTKKNTLTPEQPDGITKSEGRRR